METFQSGSMLRSNLLFSNEATTLFSEGRGPRSFGRDSTFKINDRQCRKAELVGTYSCVGERISMSGVWWETQMKAGTSMATYSHWSRDTPLRMRCAVLHNASPDCPADNDFVGATCVCVLSHVSTHACAILRSRHSRDHAYTQADRAHT